jgi:threonine synthase
VLGLDAFVVTQGEVERTMERVYRASGGTYLLDPHTAVGVAAFEEALRRVSGSGVSGSGGSASATYFAVAAREGRVVCLACAHVAKFAPTLSAALGVSVPDAVALIAKVDGSRYRNVKTVLALQTESSRPAPILFRKAEQKEWGAQLRGIVGALAWPQPQSRL